MNIRHTFLIKICYAHWVGHLRCGNDYCPHIWNHVHPNVMSWYGVSANPLVVDTLEEQRACIACSHCKLKPKCIHASFAKMLYVMHNIADLTRICVYLGFHAHLMLKVIVERQSKLWKNLYMRRSHEAQTLLHLQLVLFLLARIGWQWKCWHLLGILQHHLTQHLWRTSRVNSRTYHLQTSKPMFISIIITCTKKSIDKIMELIQCISHIDFIQNNQFLDVVPQNSTCLRCPMSQLGLGWIWLGGCN